MENGMHVPIKEYYFDDYNSTCFQSMQVFLEIENEK